MIRKNKLDSFIDRCTCKKEQRPITADIFLTDFCNEKCSYCRYSHKSGNQMLFEDFVKYVNRLLDLGVRGVILTGGGEPTINKDFNKITKYLEDCNIPYGINSNLYKYIECSPTYLKISLDTGDANEYKKIRGVDGLDKVVDNIARFCEYNKTKTQKTTIGVQCVATTEHNVVTFYNKIKHLDVDYIYYRPLESTDSQMVDKSLLESWLYSNNIADERINISYKFYYQDYMPKKCFANFCNICIDSHGFVPYCCHSPNLIVGHILDNDILIKKENFNMDMSLCEHPCRLSDANNYIENLKIEKDIFFI